VSFQLFSRYSDSFLTVCHFHLLSAWNTTPSAAFHYFRILLLLAVILGSSTAIPFSLNVPVLILKLCILCFLSIPSYFSYSLDLELSLTYQALVRMLLLLLLCFLYPCLFLNTPNHGIIQGLGACPSLMTRLLRASSKVF
jgi:hypothetical protein